MSPFLGDFLGLIQNDDFFDNTAVLAQVIPFPFRYKQESIKEGNTGWQKSDIGHLQYKFRQTALILPYSSISSNAPINSL